MQTTLHNTPPVDNGQLNLLSTEKAVTHLQECLCSECLFVPRIRDAEVYIHWCENRLAKSPPRRRDHWQHELNAAWRSLKFWRRQYATSSPQEMVTNES